MPLLEREEYVEQAYFFRALGDRLQQNMSTQDLLIHVKQEILSTTRLPMAIDYMAAELKLHGVFGTAMAKLKHYFTPFQAFVVQEAEREQGRFDFAVALEILQREAEYRSGEPTPQGSFLFQFECLCRNRLGYDKGLAAIAEDPIYDDQWREWIINVRRQIGIIDIADLIYVASEYYDLTHPNDDMNERRRPLFNEKEGKIALANRRRDPLLLFAAFERHLKYPTVPRPKKVDETPQILPAILRRLERVETRIKLLEEEQKAGGIDLSKFYGPPQE